MRQIVVPTSRRVRRTGQPTTLATMPRPVVQTATRGPLGDVQLRALGGAK